MKKTLLLFLFGIIYNNSDSQNCIPPTKHAYLYSQDASVRIQNGQGMWYNQNTSTAAYETPIGSGTSVFYAGGLWIGGKDQSQTLHHYT